MRQYLLKSFMMSLLACFSIGFTGCSDSDNEGYEPTPNPGDDRLYFNISLATSSGSPSPTYIQALTLEQISDPNYSVSFSGYGFEVPATRTARIYANEDGSLLYNLNYGGGTVAKYKVGGGQTYTELGMIDVTNFVGTEYPRWTLANEDHALVHNVITDDVYSQDDEYLYHADTMIVVSVGTENWAVDKYVSFAVPNNDDDNNLKTYVWRTDNPVIAGNRVYYGVAKQAMDPATGNNVADLEYSATTIVLDYPSLANPKTITSSVGKGSTYGYRGPVIHVDEKGDLYQLTAAPSSLLKISAGDYDNNYLFDLSAALGLKVGANVWMYVGNGIGYLPYYDTEKGSGSAAAAWSLARIDVYNKTVTKLNVPNGLWLQQFQNAILYKEKLYVPLTTIGGEGNVYIFDVNSTSADAFTKGAKIQTGADSYYIGTF